MVERVTSITKLFSVSGKIVLITGGGRGIGYMIARGFVENGSTVYISSRNQSAINKTATELSQIGPGRCFALPSEDLSSPATAERLVENFKQKEKNLHVLINNSGVTWGEPLTAYQESGWDKVMNLNVKGLFYLTTFCLPLLEATATPEDPARIINIGSVAGINPQTAPSYAYDISKAAVHHLTKKLAGELASKNITVNAIAPGLFPSKMGDQILRIIPEEELAKKMPLKRIGTLEDIAGISIYLASRAGAWVTGTTIPVDGGSLVQFSGKL